MPRILFIAHHRANRSPGQRFRFEQYFSWLQEHGFECHLSPLLPTARADRAFYQHGAPASKAAALARGAVQRTFDAIRARRFDVIFIFREAWPTGSTLFERILARSGAKTVFDFDDAIWLPTVSPGNSRFAWMKKPGKTEDIIRRCDLILAGNRHLAEYAAQFNTRVEIVPSTVDTDTFAPCHRPTRDDGIVEIGWTGSHTTIEHLRYAEPTLSALKQRYGDRIRFKVIGDPEYRHDGLGVQGIPWRAESEVEDLATIDIGLMPLPDTPWTRGKCGLKGLTYMALGVPTVMSPVGVNGEIIEEGRNGFLARSHEEWTAKVSALIENAALRERLGAAGRQTVVDRYSVRSQRDRYVRCLRHLLAAAGAGTSNPGA